MFLIVVIATYRLLNRKCHNTICGYPNQGKVSDSSHQKMAIQKKRGCRVVQFECMGFICTCCILSRIAILWVVQYEYWWKKKMGGINIGKS